MDTVFRIASMTKAITSAAAMQMVEQGKLSLDQPAGEVLPSLANPQVLEGFDADGQPQLRPARRPVTLRELADPHGGFRLRHLERKPEPLRRADRPARRAHRQARRAERAAGLRSGRALGIRHRHRLGRPHGGGGQRPEPGSTTCSSTSSARWACTTPASMPRPEWGDRLAQVHARAADGSLQPVDTPPPPAQSGILSGRRRAVLHRARLPALPAHADGRRRRWTARACCGRRRWR